MAEGYLKVRDDAGKRDESEEATSYVEKLRVLESRAKADGKGLWDSDLETIRTSYELPKANDFAHRCKGKAVEGKLLERCLHFFGMLI